MARIADAMLVDLRPLPSRHAGHVAAANMAKLHMFVAIDRTAQQHAPGQLCSGKCRDQTARPA